MHFNTGRAIVFLFIFLTKLTLADNNDPIFEQITNESGRSLGFITGIAQDSTGFMWFATRNGLYRYNGYSYKLFKHDRKDTLSLDYNDIAHLYLDRSNNLWMRHYDELSLFQNEKSKHVFEKLTGKRFDIEVKVVEDKEGNYWVGPCGNGLMQYMPAKDSLINYSNPLRSYSPKAWNYLDSLLTNTKALVRIANPGNNLDTAIQFTITTDGQYLISSSGEIDQHGIYDFATLICNGKIIWQLSKDRAMWSGGADKNCFEACSVQLKAGKYTLHYKSDLSHCCAAWDGTPPDKISVCGASLIPITRSNLLTLKNTLVANKPATYLSSNKIKDILIDNDGHFVALTNIGLEEFDYKTHTFKHHPISFAKLLGVDIEDEFLTLYQDRKGSYWIGSVYGLIKYDLLWNKFSVIQNKDDAEILTSNTIFSIFEDHEQNIWIGTDKGLNIYNQELQTMQKIKANNRNRLYDDRIIQIFEDQAQNIWVATFKGLNRLIKNPFDFVSLNIDASNQFPVIADNSQYLWYANGNKICRYSMLFKTCSDYTLPKQLFNINEFTREPEYEIIDFELTKNKTIWLSTDNKLSCYNLNTSKIDCIKEIPAIIVGNDSIKNQVKAIFQGNEKNLYLISPVGLYIFNTQTLKMEKFHPFPITYEFIDEVDLNYFKNAFIDANKHLWIRTNDGISEYSPQLNQLKLVFEFDNKIKYGPLATGNLTEDTEGNIWFSALPNIYKINKETHDVKFWTADYEHDWGASEIKMINKRVWIYGTNGLYKFNPENETFSYYSIEDGLADNNINGIEQDQLGFLWITSLKGLSKFDINDENAESFFKASDLIQYQFIGNHPKFKMPDNQFLFFTTQGVVCFNPNKINTRKPNIVINNFTIRGKELELDSLIYQINNITLSYKQNFLGFEFAALDYTAPAKNRYKYKMEGLDEDWIYVDANNRTASYPGLSPGRYTFRVMGSNNDKVWNEVGTYLNITITPPWYKTLTAYLAYIILVVSIIWGYIKIRERNLKEEKRILEQKVKERTAEIVAQKEELAHQKERIEEQHKNITDSIQYAQRIQAAILPSAKQIKDYVDEYFILYRPRDIVSGDYYWTTHNNDITIIVAADCTGHGVPGAFMSMLGIAFLNEIVLKEGIIEPDQILNRLRQQVMNQLHQTGQDGESKDGMDISLYVIDHKNRKLRFSGAYNPLYIIRNNDVIQLKADRMPIGYHIKKDTPFSMEEIDLQKGDCLYNSSDGYPDQFGGPDGRKFMSKNFKDLLLSIHQKPMNEQRDILDKAIDDWRGNIEQIDDIIVFGVRI